MTGEKKGIVTDADGTIWGFPEYFVPAMRIVVPMLAELFSQKLGRLVTWDEVSHELGRIMALRGTHEWPWVLEETKFWADPDYRRVWNSYSEFLDKAVVPFWTTLDNSCRKNCVLMEEFVETAEELKKQGKFIVIHSKGPLYSVRKKIWQLGVDKLITAAYAMALPEPEGLSDKELAYGRERVRMFSSLELACPIEEMPTEFAKPDPRGLQKILKAMGAKPLEALMVGDSLLDDGGVAEACGVPFLWARYGTHLPPDYLRTINEHFLPPNLRKKKVKKFPPMVDKDGAASWKEVLNHLDMAALVTTKTALSSSARPEPIEGLPS